MISKIQIANLKSIKQLEIECSDINVFIGTNSSGKSSILQGLLFTMQNMETPKGLNGELISLGEFSKNRCFYSEDRKIKAGLNDTNGNSAFMSLYTNGEMLQLERTYEPETGGRKRLEEEFSLINRKVQYLSCRRVGPQELYKKNMSMIEGIGNEGEYAISYLNKHGADAIEPQLCRNDKDFTLLGQVNWWLAYIADAEISTSEVQGTNYVKASYSMYDLKEMSPDNVGAGISYLISILIVCLSAPENSIIVIENPEIHLHPSAQSRVCEFLYYVACRNRQIFVESHSDHIFNGFRAGIAAEEMDKERIGVQFTWLNENHVTDIEKVKFGVMGRIENPRKDMFDQFDLDLNKMIGVM